MFFCLAAAQVRSVVFSQPHSFPKKTKSLEALRPQHDYNSTTPNTQALKTLLVLPRWMVLIVGGIPESIKCRDARAACPSMSAGHVAVHGLWIGRAGLRSGRVLGGRFPPHKWPIGKVFR